MNREEIMATLLAHESETEAFGIKSLRLFGSAARGEAGPQSDADFLVEFDGPVTYDRYSEFKFYLEDLLGVSVDLVTVKALKPRMKPIVEREAIRVA
ncbi:MAG: nucleotidyltransferase family protein [Dehalococcoidia bacterium]